MTQRFRENTVVMPTWMCPRSVFDAVGGFNEGGKGTPEDMIFFYHHLRLGGALAKVHEQLLMYRYHEECTSFSVPPETIWQLRLTEFERAVVDGWDAGFCIWGAGKEGRRLYRTLSKANQNKVTAFCDVDPKKLAQGTYNSESNRGRRIPIIHFRDATPPFVLCVKGDRTDGEFEQNVRSLGLEEGVDFWHFS
jgi:hypothetical protein